MVNATDKTAQELAAFCTATADPDLAKWRVKVLATCAAKHAAGTYLPNLAWRDWLWLVDSASMWIKARPDAPIRRDGEHVRYAHTKGTRKTAARILASGWLRGVR
jgi:hypothetical protein